MKYIIETWKEIKYFIKTYYYENEKFTYKNKRSLGVVCCNISISSTVSQSIEY